MRSRLSWTSFWGSPTMAKLGSPRAISHWTSMSSASMPTTAPLMALANMIVLLCIAQMGRFYKRRRAKPITSWGLRPLE
jgi:hypothetical protein